MRIERWTLADAGDADATVASIRELAPRASDVSAAVVEIVAAVRARGDLALSEYVSRFDLRGDPAPQDLRVAPADLTAALDGLDAELREALETAIANVAEVAAAGGDDEPDVMLAEGHRVRLREIPVQRAGIYAPGGRAPYPSTVVMGAVTARAAGVETVAVATPPPIAAELLGACALCGVDEVYAMGGAHAIAALAYGTESVAAVDVIAGPGNLYVQEAKRLVAADVGIEGFAGPSDLLVLFDATDEGSLHLIALDLLAQAEHGPETLVLAIGTDAGALARLGVRLQHLAEARPQAQPAACVLVEARSLDDALALANRFAPEHLELIGPGAEALAPRVRAAGCLFVGWPAATAFGDYVCGSNHILPTGGAARFQSGLSVRHFRRRMAEVRIGAEAAALLADHGARIAAAEGFTVHGESMRARVRDNRTQ